MLEIRGKYADAICYASIIEEEAIEQVQTLCDQKFAKGSKIRLMPDAHAGKGCTIGTTMTIIDSVCPNLVGVDLGCGMLTTWITNKTDMTDEDIKRLDEACHLIPSGHDVWEGRMKHFNLQELRCYRNLKNTKRLERSLGTLGGGNHFIELDRSEFTGDHYVIIHSGSRNLGKQVAEYYQGLAIDLAHGKEDYFKKRDEIIHTYKEQGRRGEIQEALKKLKCETKESIVPDDLAYLYGSYMEDYLHDVFICQHFADESRKLMRDYIFEHCGFSMSSAFSTIHNYIDKKMILRKGAIDASEGNLMLIPLNMRDGCIIGEGRGNVEWNYSAPHGAGRIMSRKKARETLSLEDYKREMQGIYSTSVNLSTIDEAPMAYKSKEAILQDISESVSIKDILKPVYNFKAEG